MRSFFSVAILVASATAVNQFGSYTPSSGYYHQQPTPAPEPVPEHPEHTHYDEESLVHHHHHPIEHVDVWATITDDLDALTDGAAALTALVAGQDTAVDALADDYAALMQAIIDSQVANNAVTVLLAVQKEMDVAQDAMIANLIHDVTKLEHSCRDVENMVVLFGLVIDSLPDFTVLQAALDAVTDTNALLRIAAEANRDELDALATAVTDGTTAVETLSDRGAAEGLSLLRQNIVTQATAITASNVPFQAVQDALDSQKIIADYYYVNDAAIDFVLPGAGAYPIAQNQLFCVGKDQTVEFWLAATTNGIGGAGNGDVISFSLVKAQIIYVADSSYGDPVVGGTVVGGSRPHTLFYKETVTADSTFSVVWTGSGATPGNTPAGVDAQQLMWGYKIYDAGYEILTDAMHSTCGGP